MSDSRDGALHRALGRPELARVWAAARRRLEEGGDVRSFTVADLSDPEAEALAQLLGSARPSRGRVRVSIEALDRALRDSRLGVGLRAALELLSGPLADRRAERAAGLAARDMMWSEAAAHPAVARHPELVGWVDDLRRAGALARAAAAAGAEEATLLARALDVLARLPAGGLSLSTLAADVTGDAHALDADRPLGGIVLRAGARLLGQTDAATGASERRRLWAELGVFCDPLAAHVLVLGLRVTGHDLLARQLGECAEAGEPRRVMLRELQRERLSVAAGTEVFVCENPSVVLAAADGVGPRSRALVCTEGMPSSAALELLLALAHAGATLRTHADFDWGGVRVVNFLARTVPAIRPWRLSCEDYERSLSRCRETAPLRGAPVEASWDSALAGALAASRRAVLEEHVVMDLLGDLAGS